MSYSHTPLSIDCSGQALPLLNPNELEDCAISIFNFTEPAGTSPDSAGQFLKTDPSSFVKAEDRETFPVRSGGGRGLAGKD